MITRSFTEASFSQSWAVINTSDEMVGGNKNRKLNARRSRERSSQQAHAVLFGEPPAGRSAYRDFLPVALRRSKPALATKGSGIYGNGFGRDERKEFSETSRIVLQGGVDALPVTHVQYGRRSGSPTGPSPTGSPPPVRAHAQYPFSARAGFHSSAPCEPIVGITFFEVESG